MNTTVSETYRTDLKNLLSQEVMQDITEQSKRIWADTYKELSKLFTNSNPYLLHTSGGELIKIRMDAGYVKYSKYAGYLYMSVEVPIALLESDQLEYEEYLRQEQEQPNLYNVNDEHGD